VRGFFFAEEIVLATLLMVILADAGQSATLAQSPRPNQAQQQLALTHNRAGWSYLAAERWEPARDEFLQAIELNTRLVTAHYGLGKAYMGLRAYPAAVGAFEACRDVHKMMQSAVLTTQLERNQWRQEYMRELEEALREQQRAATGTRAQSQTGRHVSDLEHQMRLLRDEERSGASIGTNIDVPAEVYLALGSALFRSERLAEAEVEYRNALQTRPGYGEAHNNLAVIYLLSGRYDESEQAIKQAERNGFRVNPQLKEDLKAAKGK
jgi:tetratricopeptide (TPR) repeat protein